MVGNQTTQIHIAWTSLREEGSKSKRKLKHKQARGPRRPMPQPVFVVWQCKLVSG